LNYCEAIEQSIHFIETNIKDELTAEQIAHGVGYSVFHFCRIFAMSQGVPLMEFVRKKRLLLSRTELLNNHRIIEVALDYGFETASGFSKAFRKEFGYSPTTYISRMSGCGIKEIITNIGGIMMNPVIRKKSTFKVAGYGISTNIAESFTKDIAAYWTTYHGENLESKMYKQLNPPKHGEVGICVPCLEKGHAIYLLGVIVDDFEKVTPDMMSITVPEAEYAVFTTPPVHNISTAQAYDDGPLSIAVKETWRYIFNEWLPNSNYEFDETKMDFEFYDERCHGLENAVMEIYVPITHKSA
jgi:AraC family transcriptional regulator